MKKVRSIFSTLFFLSLIYIFYFSGSNIARKVIELSQFGPSITGGAFSVIAGLFGAITAIVLSIIFGRIYCSFLCPVGYIHDIFTFLSLRVFKIKFEFSKPKRIIKYLIFATVFILFGFGINGLFNILEPFSIFGRIITNVVKPLLVLINNFISNNGMTVIEHIEIQTISAGIFIVSLIYLMLFVFFGAFMGRFYCNNICPVGTFLGILSNTSLMKLSIDKQKCVKCGMCEVKCKGKCIDSSDKKIYNENCVMCFNCLECPKGAVWFNKNKKEGTEDINGRREFFKSAGLSAAAMFGVAGMKVAGLAGIKHGADYETPISPPGSKSIIHFRDLCIGCNLCVNKCPSNIIKPSLLEYGVDGMMKPYLSYDKGFCQYECNECSKVCPTGAIQKIEIEEKKKTQIGKVNLKKELCIVYREKRDCGACSEHCPTKAVHMVEFEGNYRAPETDTDICIGCGACEYICPVRPEKAITVLPNKEHKLIKEKKKENIKQLDSTDFPF